LLGRFFDTGSATRFQALNQGRSSADPAGRVGL